MLPEMAQSTAFHCYEVGSRKGRSQCWEARKLCDLLARTAKSHEKPGGAQGFSRYAG
jgi:hypothetical protein